MEAEKPVPRRVVAITLSDAVLIVADAVGRTERPDAQVRRDRDDVARQADAGVTVLVAPSMTSTVSVAASTATLQPGPPPMPIESVMVPVASSITSTRVWRPHIRLAGRRVNCDAARDGGERDRGDRIARHPAPLH
jgi:hypothetical protein